MTVKPARNNLPRIGILSLFIAFMLGISFVDTVEAVVNPEIIQWRARQNADFLTSLFTGVLGRAPTQDEFNFYINRDLNRNMGRGEAFWSLIGSQEYRNGFGSGQGPYQIRWKSRQIRTERGMWWCHCYFFTKDPSLTGGHTAAMQYLGVRTPWSSYSFSVARTVTRMFAMYDAEVCPNTDCGLNGADINELFNDRSDGGGGSNNSNLIKDYHFANFYSRQAWGTGLYSEKGVWWNSNKAQSRATVINLGQNIPPGAKAATALHLQNFSGSGPHVYGTTSQRINVQQGTRYTISFWGSAKNMAANGALYIVVDREWKIRPINMNGGTYGWTYFSGSFVAPANYIDLRIVFANSGEAWITEMKLVRSN